MIESKIEEYLRKEVERLEGKCLKWVCPQVNGVPDRIVLLNGKTYFVELKRPDGRWAALQIIFARWLVNYKYDYSLILSEYEVDCFIKRITK